MSDDMNAMELGDVRRMIADIVGVEGEDVQERREAIAQTWITTFLNRGFMKRDYQKERDLEHLAIMTSMIASGFATKDGIPAKTVASRAIDIALEVITQIRKARQ